MNYMKRISKNVKKTIVAGITLSLLTFSPQMASISYAANWDLVQSVIVGAMGASMGYQAVRDNMLAVGNNPNFQKQTLEEDLKRSERDTTPSHNAIVKSVMTQLIEKGDYALRSNSLPFRYRINNSGEWNAACYPTNYISINRGLVEDLGRSEDALAAILGHEMTHGLEQHLANDQAKNFLATYGAQMVAGALDQVQGNIFGLISNYAIVKNVSVNSEKDADEKGFHIMTSAGFNPGGFPIAMMHMGLQDKYMSPSLLQEVFLGAMDHPKTKTRVKRGIQWMQDYGMGHVSVKDKTNVYVDDTLLLTASSSNGMEDWENAYLIAGGISKGIHDNRLLSGWNFVQKSDGTAEFLNNDRVYRPLKEAINQNHLGSVFERMIAKAYNSDSRSGAREKYMEKENKLRERNENLRQKEAKKGYTGDYLYKARQYKEMNLPHLVKFEANRALANDPTNGYAYEFIGVGYAMEGNFNKAYENYQKAFLLLTEQEQNAELYSQLSEAQFALGMYHEAELSVKKSLALDPKGNDYVYSTQGYLYDRSGNVSGALGSFKKVLEFNPNASIPAKYANMIANESAQPVDMKDFDN